MLGDGDKGIEIVYGEEKKYFVLGRLEQPRQIKNLMYQHDKPNETTKEGPLSFVFFEFQQSAEATPLYSLYISQLSPKATESKRETGQVIIELPNLKCGWLTILVYVSA